LSELFFPIFFPLHSIIFVDFPMIPLEDFKCIATRRLRPTPPGPGLRAVRLALGTFVFAFVAIR
jgi:hypothetical protein